MATARDLTTETPVPGLTAAPRTTKGPSGSDRITPNRTPGRAADMTSQSADLHRPAENGAAFGASDRKYSFNALVAIGIIGFVAGRICAR